MIATYNTNVGDVLMLITANDKGEKVNFERKGKVARVFIEETGATVAWNIFERNLYWLICQEMVKSSYHLMILKR